jgi:N-acetylglutamate synthase-like GNAT family acetyltransferase
MEIRQAGDNDIPAIVSLLKVSLGEGLLAKSEDYWRWKHVENPFGRSPVLVGIENEMIIGVRAFMCWTWQRNGKSIRAVRAVDTATHPDHQGKGIFSKLTKALLQESEADGLSLVFNTPNSKSMPGYLKMGWEEAGRVPVRAYLRKPFSMAFNAITNKKNGTTNIEPPKPIEELLGHRSLPDLLAIHMKKYGDVFITPHSVASLTWRYQTVPVEKYFANGIERSGELGSLMFYRIKETRFGRELRITDVFDKGTLESRDVRKMIHETGKLHRADFVTIGALQNRTSMPNPNVKKAGPVVTVRKIQGEEVQEFKGFNNWLPSIGDLELF